MSTNRVKILAIGILSIVMIAFAGYSLTGGKKAKATHLTTSDIPFFNEEYGTTNPTKSIAKRILFKAHYLSKMMGASKTSEFSKVADNWFNRLNKEAFRLKENDKTVATSILSIMRSYEDMKTFRSMGLTHAKNFWPVITTLMQMKMTENHLSADSHGFSSCVVKDKQENHKAADSFGITACAVKKTSGDQLIFWERA